MKKTYTAFLHAFAGLSHAFRNERNFRTEIVCAGLVCGCGIFFNLTKTEWLIIILNTGTVFMAELFNTAVEGICNEHSKEIKPAIKIIKDVSAAAVLISAVAAAACGILIFLPYVKEFIKLKI